MIAVVFTACRKSEDGPNPVPATKNYFPLAVGNYWVYENYQIYPDGNRVKKDEVDSLFISEITELNGKSYFHLKGTRYPVNNTISTIYYLRDSSDYLVNHIGVIEFSPDNFSDTLFAELVNQQEVDTFYYLSYQMVEEDVPVVVPAGAFDVLNYRGTVYMPEHTDPDFRRRYINNYFAENMGKIFYEFMYLSGGLRIQKELIRFHIKNQ